MNWQPEILFTVLGFLLSFAITLAVRDKILEMIAAAGFVRPNYKGRDIPLAAGIIFLISTLPTMAVVFPFLPDSMRHVSLVYLFAASGAACLGLMDDYWGSREASGLLGHFKALCRGRLTTGAIKALGGGLIALIAGAWLFPGEPRKIAESFFIIALSVNMVNLFDLRPGRAGKIYLLLYIILLPASLGRPEALFATLVLGSLLAYLSTDLKARAMMGDVGSNTLGMVIGITAAAALDGAFRTSYLAAVVVIHIITERYSLTRIIAGNVVLNYLDMLGREKESGNKCRK